jgi:hypothetical protein
MTDEPLKVNADADRINALELKVHALEVEKRAMLIRTHFADFDSKDKSIEYLDGFNDGIIQGQKLKQHSSSVAEVTSKGNKAKRIGDVIDEDEQTKSGSDL